MAKTVRIIMDKQENFVLDESVFQEQNLIDIADLTVLEIPLPRSLTNEESDEYANRLANMMFDEGHDDFDIEFLDDADHIEEETYHGDEFFENYGVLGYVDDDDLWEAEYQGRTVKLNKPMRGDVKKFKVYVKDPKTGNVKKVNFGDPNMRIKKSNPDRRRSFRARHNCDNPGPKTKARYWSCKKW